jgi:hypothetical protein
VSWNSFWAFTFHWGCRKYAKAIKYLTQFTLVPSLPFRVPKVTIRTHHFHSSFDKFQEAERIKVVYFAINICHCLPSNSAQGQTLPSLPYIYFISLLASDPKCNMSFNTKPSYFFILLPGWPTKLSLTVNLQITCESALAYFICVLRQTQKSARYMHVCDYLMSLVSYFLWP